MPDAAYLNKYLSNSIKGLQEAVWDPMYYPYSEYKKMKVPETSYSCIAMLASN